MGGLNVTRSNRLEVLAVLLAEQLRRGGDPFVPLQVVVGSRGMDRHLRQVLAERLGVCANINFPFPNAALDGLAPLKVRGRDPWSAESLTWALLEVLPSAEAEPLQRYLAAERVGSAVGARTWGLAEQVAHTFDRYITHRPELVQGWKRSHGVPENERWQAVLWRAVRAQLGDPPHRAERLASLVDLQPSSQPLHVFGLSSMARTWLQALGVVAKSRPVELYLLCPSDRYWGDLRRRSSELTELSLLSPDDLDTQLCEEDRSTLGALGHPLLRAWGRVGRNLQVLLGDLPDGFIDSDLNLFVEPEVHSALQQIQADILHAGHPVGREGFAERTLKTDDRSIQLHACHGLTRQVEELRTVLLELLDADPTLHPRDIVVMTPDIDTAAPIIGGVFEGGQHRASRGRWFPTGSPRLPWELADLAVRRVNPVAEAMLRVLALVDGRACASEVLDLLALEPVAERFSLDPDDLLVLRDWVIASGIRWAEDATQRAAHAQPADLQNTWRFGLDRLLLGIAIPDTGELVHGIRPVETVEGAGTVVLGRFVEFCANLFEQLDLLQKPRSLQAWVGQLIDTLSALTATSGESAWFTRSVRDEIDGLQVEAELSKSEVELGVDALRAALTRRFEMASDAHHGSGGAITFCGMVPERAVPYRVVCLLGMDEGSFPRHGAQPAFDLLQQAPQVGDRSLRDEDRYLLLEAVLSARDNLLIFYTGRDVRTNEKLPPAIPVTELADALDASWPPQSPSPSELFTTVHTLQAFDPRNFGLGAAPWSYDQRLLRGVRASVSERQSAQPFLRLGAQGTPDDRAELTVAELVSFWRYPLQSYLKRELRIWLAWEGEDEVPDREPLELGWLDQQLLLDQLLLARRDGLPPQTVRSAMRGTGQLPLGTAGEVAFEGILGLAEALEQSAESLVGWSWEVPSVDIDLTLDEGRLVGRVDGVGDRALVVCQYGNEQPRTLIETWIRLLCWRLQDPDSVGRALILFGSLEANGDPKLIQIGLELTSDCDPGQTLSELIQYYREGLRSPLPFFVNTSRALTKALLHPKNGLPPEWHDPDSLGRGGYPDHVAAVLRQATSPVLNSWSDGRGRGEGEGRYHRHAFADSLPFLDPDGTLRPDFVALSVRIWGPILAARRTAAKLKKW